jgi:4-hydroxy-tetrahydrodipicolinate synthase
VAEPGTRLTIDQAQRVAKLGVDGIVVTSPYYFRHDSVELLDHFTAVASSVSVPTILYDIPQTVGTVLEVNLIAKLAHLPDVIGIKDSSGDMTHLQQILGLRERIAGFQVWQGAEPLAGIAIARGADGAVLGLANIAPSLCCELYQAAHKGDLPAAWALQEKLMRLYTIQNHRSFLAGLKTAASYLGLCGMTTTLPFEPLNETQATQVRQTLVDLSLLPD